MRHQVIDETTGEVLRELNDRYKSTPVTVEFEGQGRTHQEFKEDCDINVIIDRLTKRREFAPIAPGTPKYGDFSTAGDYMTAVLNVQTAQRAFEQLPAKVRKAVDNDPGRLLEAINDPTQLEDLKAAGLQLELPGTPEATNSEGGETPTPAEPETADEPQAD